MWEIWTYYLLPKGLKTCPKSNKLPNLVTLANCEVFAAKKLSKVVLVWYILFGLKESITAMGKYSNLVSGLRRKPKKHL